MELRDELTVYHTLYHAGGWADQPFGLMRRINAAYNVYTAIHAWRQSKNWVEFQHQYPQAWEIVILVKELREHLNG